MSNDVWITTLLSIPVGVGTGLLISPIRRWIRNRGKTRDQVRKDKALWDYILTLYYHANPEAFTQYLITQCIEAAHALFTLAITLMAQGAVMWLAVLARLKPPITRGDKIAMVSGMIFSVIGFAFATLQMTATFKAVAEFWRHAFFLDPFDKVPPEIRRLDIEQEARQRRDLWFPVETQPVHRLETRAVNRIVYSDCVQISELPKLHRLRDRKDAQVSENRVGQDFLEI